MGVVAVLKPKTANVSSDSSSNTSSSSSSSPPLSPPSPRRQMTVPLLRRRSRSKTQSESLSGMLLRKYLRYLVVLPLFYFSGLLICIGPFSGFLRFSSPPGTLYRSNELFQKLWNDIQADNQTQIEVCGFLNFGFLLQFRLNLSDKFEGILMRLILGYDGMWSTVVVVAIDFSITGVV